MKDIRKVIGLLLCMTISCYMMGEEKKNLNIVFIGNSITQGALLENPRHEAPPVKAALYLRRQPCCRTVRYSNRGKRKYELLIFYLKLICYFRRWFRLPTSSKMKRGRL